MEQLTRENHTYKKKSLSKAVIDLQHSKIGMTHNSFNYADPLLSAQSSSDRYSSALSLQTTGLHQPKHRYYRAELTHYKQHLWYEMAETSYIQW